MVVIGFLASYGFMSGRELYDRSHLQMETDASSTSIGVLDIDPKPLEIDEIMPFSETQSWEYRS